MRKVSRSALVPYSAEQMYALVKDVESYPAFLPWCNDAEVHIRGEDFIEASLELHRGRISKKFRTRNQLKENEWLGIELVGGPRQTSFSGGSSSTHVIHWLTHLRSVRHRSMQVEVVFALAEKQVLQSVELSAGATVADAIDASTIAQQFPGVDLGELQTGMWGKPVERTREVRDGDRVELYRPLEMDPREARRLRAGA
jgi:putative ubiquitin-RnfH superfamily antitoxin RatB of RatAB toxin-antitoxin module